MPPPVPEKMLLRSLRFIRTFALAALVALTAGYWFTNEPAPRIRVEWRRDVTPQQQNALERKYFLLNGRDPMPGGSTAYDLLDTSRSNIKALVEDPAVADTGDIDRTTYVVPDGTDPGGEEMWIADRAPFLREAAPRWTLVAILAMLVIAGFRREVWVAAAMGKHAAAIWRAHWRAPRDSRDLFGALTGSPQTLVEADSFPNRVAIVVTKLLVATLLILVTGVPVLKAWESLVVAAGLLVLVFGTCRAGRWRLAAATIIVLGLIGLKAILPRADIAEAHNAFLVLQDGEALQRGLPPSIFGSWRAQLNALYPVGSEPSPEYSWRTQKAVPRALYAWSADAIWRHAKYSRQVDAINFRTISEFRAGFTSEMYAYNFWVGDLDREVMPFYVMYELTAPSVGSQLAWTGQVFWEQADGEFQEIVHAQPAARTIRPEDAGKRVYAVFFPKRGVYFQMIPSWRLRLGAWADALLTLIGSFSVIVLTIRPRWGAYLRALSLFLTGYLVMTLLAAPESGRLGEDYRPHGGGNDGLFHENGGRTMARLVASGHIVEALKGTEAVYWFTPGTQYVRMVEKLVFGDTNHLFALVLAAIPIVVFYTMRRFVGPLPAWVVTGMFCVMPIGNPSFLQYVTNARAGFGDGVGAGLFLLGLVLVLYNQPAASGGSLVSVWVAGASLAGSMFIRPNFALAVAWLGCLYAWIAWTRRDWYRIFAMSAGLGLALWMPFHNWFYGGEFYLISRSGATISVPLGLRDYLSAATDVLYGRTATSAMAATSTQLAGWLWGSRFFYTNAWQPLLPVVHIIELFAFATVVWVVCQWVTRRASTDIALTFIAGAAIWAHVPMLFIFSTYYRYSVLAWDLSVIVLIIWLVRSREIGVRAGHEALQLEPFRVR